MWLDEFRARVLAHPRRRAIVANGQSCSYAGLWRRCKARGLALAQASRHPRLPVAHRDPLATLEDSIGAWIQARVPAILSHELPERSCRELQRLIAAVPDTSASGTPDRLRFADTRDAERREALLMTTAGTTGHPKLVALSHRSVCTTVAALRRWYAQPEHTRVLVATPLFRTRGLISNVLVGLSSGWTLHLYPSGTPGSVLASHIRAHRIRVINGAPSFFRLFLRYWTGEPFPSVRHVSLGGESVPWPLVEALRAAFPRAQCHITYGITEAGVRVSHICTTDPRARAGACGVPLPHHAVRVEPVPEAQLPAGELCLKGDSVFLGYLEPDGRHGGLDAEGYFHTADLVRPDPDGCLYHLGRRDALVKVGGLLVNPHEVEQILRSLPGVSDARCRGKSDDLLGFVLTAQVVTAPGADLDEAALRRACAKLMERYKVPRDLRIVDRLSETFSGKTTFNPSSR